MRISDWSSYVCSSDLLRVAHADLRDQGCDRITTLDDELQQPLAFAFACRRKISERRREQLARLGQQRREVGQIGRASCRESVCQYVSISVVAVSLKKQRQTNQQAQK